MVMARKEEEKKRQDNRIAIMKVRNGISIIVIITIITKIMIIKADSTIASAFRSVDDFDQQHL